MQYILIIFNVNADVHLKKRAIVQTFQKLFTRDVFVLVRFKF